MLLAADIGNSLTKIGIFDGDTLVNSIKIPTGSLNADSLSNLEFDKSAFSSVVPAKSGEFSRFISEMNRPEPYQISITSKLNFKNGYKSAETLGTDRICGIAGAAGLLKKESKGIRNFITVDLGTATTVNFVFDSTFLGGMIAPGIGTMLKSLHTGTSQLPEVGIDDFEDFIGGTTKSSIASGAVSSALGLIDQARNIMTEKAGGSGFELFITGGHSKLVSGMLDFKHRLSGDLVIRGIAEIYRENVES